jgi:SRSO17 transposase
MPHRAAAFRRGLERFGLRYGLAVRWSLAMWTTGARRTRTAAEITTQIPDHALQRISSARDQRRLGRPLCGGCRSGPAKSRGAGSLLCERALSGDERKYYLLNLEATATLRQLVTLVRSRWPIEQHIRELKDEVGVDHFEGRTYRGWTHHIVLTTIAFTFFQFEQMRSDDEPRPTLQHVRLCVREIMAVLYVVSNRKLLNLIVGFQRNPPLRR